MRYVRPPRVHIHKFNLQEMAKRYRSDSPSPIKTERSASQINDTFVSMDTAPSEDLQETCEIVIDRLHEMSGIPKEIDDRGCLLEKIKLIDVLTEEMLRRG
jgi:hypothetical protein